jgi:hypothetical protein
LRAEQHSLYIPEKEWNVLIKTKKRTGISVSKLLIKGFNYWLQNNPKELGDLAEELKGQVEIREVKEKERQTGDYLGSFEKMEKKLRAIDKSDLSSEKKKLLKAKTRERYQRTQGIYEKKIFGEKASNKRKRKNSGNIIEFMREKMSKEHSFCKKCKGDCRTCRFAAVALRGMSVRKANEKFSSNYLK